MTHILCGNCSRIDYEFERTIRNAEGDFDSGICIFFMMPPRPIAELSSRMIKGLIGPKGWQRVVRKHVPNWCTSTFSRTRDELAGTRSLASAIK